MSTTRQPGGSSLPAPTTAQFASSPTTPGTAERCTTRSGCSGAYACCVRLTQEEGECSHYFSPRHACSVSSVRFSGDGLYVFSGSEDMNLRIWKASASRQLGTVRCPNALQTGCGVLHLTQAVCRACHVRKRKLLSTQPWFRATHTCPRSSALHGACNWLSDPLPP